MKKIYSLIVMMCFTAAVMAFTPVLVGSSVICNGEHWNNQTSVNVMTEKDGGNYYEFTINYYRFS